MESTVVNALYITGGLFLLGGILGTALLIFPYKLINLSLKIYDKFTLLGVSRTAILVDPHGKVTVTFYRMFGLMLILISAIPLLIIFYGCVLHKCTPK